MTNFAGTLAASVHFPTTGPRAIFNGRGERTTLRFSEMPRTVIKKLLTAGGAILAHWRHL